MSTDDAPSVEEFEQRYREYFHRVGALDLDFLEQTLDPGYFSSDPLGVRRFKPEYIEFCKQSFAEPMRATFSDSHLRLLGDVAIFSTRATLGPHPLGEHTVRLLSIWERQEGRWRYIAQQGTLLSQDADG